MLRKLPAATILATVVVLLVPHAAYASDAYVSYQSSDSGTWEAKYDDLTDNLCVRKGVSGVITVRGRIVRQNGSGPNFSVTTPGGEGWVCTGNLSIPEDQPYILYLDRKLGGSWLNGLRQDSFYS